MKVYKLVALANKVSGTRKRQELRYSAGLPALGSMGVRKISKNMYCWIMEARSKERVAASTAGFMTIQVLESTKEQAYERKGKEFGP